MKFELDNRTGLMRPKAPAPLEFQNLVGGLKVIDNILHTSFIILKRTDEIGYAQGIVSAKGPNVFDTRTARIIADKVRRIMPRSKYKDFRMFLRGYKQPLETLEKEDEEILEHLVNQYDNTLNERLGIGVDTIEYSDKRTKGVDMKGIKGALQALPSAIIPFLICPPMALISLLGAVHNRLTERYLKSKMNSKVWLDYIAMSKPSDLKEKVKKAQQQKIQYYYSTLANGEILKVPAVNTIEAKDMILAISRKDIEPRYANYDNGYCHIEDNVVERGLVDNKTGFFESNLSTNSGDKVKMWCVKFSDGQACYAFGNDGQRDEIMEKAVESRKAVIDYYKSVVLKGEKPDKNGKHGTDNWKDTKMKHGGIGHEGDDEEYEMLFTVPHVDDMIEITNRNMYFPITRDNDRDFSTPQTGALSWQPRKNPAFRIPIGEIGYNQDIIFNIPAMNEEECGMLLGNLSLSNDFKAIIKQQQIIREILDNCCLNTYTGNDRGFKILSDCYHTSDDSDKSFTIDQYTLNVCGHLFNMMLFKPSPYAENLKNDKERLKRDLGYIFEGLKLIGDQRKQNLTNYIISESGFKRVQETLKSVMTTALYNKASKATKSEMYKQMNNMSPISNERESNTLSGDENMNKFSTWNAAADIFEARNTSSIDNCELINPDTDEIMNSDISVQVNFKRAV